MEELKHVSLPVSIRFDESYDNNKFLRVFLTFAHDGINPNKSRFTINDLVSHQDSLYLSPLLGNIVQDEDGNYDFGGHDMEFRPNPFKDGETEIYYLENIVGIIPPKEMAEFSTEVIDGRNYVTVIGYVYKEYSNYAEDIIQEFKRIPVSMEIDVYSYSYDVKENVYDITDFAYKGITFLNQNCGTGMIGANAKLFSQSDLSQIMFTISQELKKAFESGDCNNEIQKEGGNDVLEENTNITPVVEDPATETATEQSTEQFTEVATETSVTESEIEVSTAPVEDETAVEETTSVEQEVFNKTFAISHDDVRFGLYQLLEAVEEADNEWYYIEDVYDEYFDYSGECYGCKTRKRYRQHYVHTDTSVEFSGERYEIFVEKLTAAEKATLDALRANYSAEHSELEELRTFKADYDAAVLKSAQDAVIAEWSAKIGENVEAFEELKKDYSTFSVEDLTVKCKCIFADAKSDLITTTFAANTKSKETGVYVNITPEVNTEKTKEFSPYGNLFDLIKQ